MQLEISSSGAHEYYVPPSGHTASMPVGPALDAFKAYLERTGRICPKPWCWKRFFILFKPACEPPWLSSWWVMSAQEKKDLFLQQVEYLARHTDQFHMACRFLHELDKEFWLLSGTEKLARGHPERDKL